MSQAVLDSGVLIAAVFPETHTLRARKPLHQLQADRVTLHAPVLLRYELVAVCRKSVHRGRLSPEEGLVAMEQLSSCPVTLHYDEALLKRAYALAEEFSRPTAYDAQYLALAERLGCDLWTADERLFNGVSARLPTVRWLAADRDLDP